jgi:5-methylcytosine-specific restriction endonuclease McrA
MSVSIGYKLSDETREKMRLAHIGKPSGMLGHKNPHSAETRNKIRLAHIGKKKSKEHCLKISESKKGIAPLIMTEEIKQKISNRLKGLKRSDESKKKLSDIGKTKLGSLNNNWKGGITPKTRRQRNLFRKRLRLKILERDNYTCVICSVKNPFMHVDHIKSWKDNENLRFDADNCRTLCENCHYKLTYNKTKPENISWNGYSKCIQQRRFN